MPSFNLYGTSVADSVLTSANGSATVAGGTETSQQCDMNGGNNWGEIVHFFTNPTVDFTAIQPPTGRGWVYNKPGAGTFAAGTWTLKYTWFGVGGDTVTLTWRVYKFTTPSTYSAIGSVVTSSFAIPATKTLTTFPNLSGSLTTFGANDLVYWDIWLNDTGGAGGDNPTTYMGNSLSAGVANDMQILTPNFTPSGTPHIIIFDGLGGMFK